MESIKKAYEELINEIGDGCARIECTQSGGEDCSSTISVTGHKALLYCCACDILEQLARCEGDDLGSQVTYVLSVCQEAIRGLERKRKADD